MPAVLAPSLRGYRRAWLRGDLVAGATVWAVLVPESLAYATIAGVPPAVGLYAAVPALVLYALVGSSRHLIVGPMAATAALSAGVIGDLGVTGPDAVAMTTALAITVGLIAVVAGAFRLGFLASFISEPVLKGFIIGLALTIAVGQVPKLLGIEKGDGDFFAQLWYVVTHLGDTQLLALVVGAAVLAIVLGLRRWLPVVPGSLVAVALAIAAVWVLGLDAHGLDVVGPVPSGLPPLGLPDVPVSSYLDLASGAVGVALVGFAEGLGAAKTYATRGGYRVDVDRELVGLGVANLGAGLTSGMVVNGSLSKTAVNGSAGARSEVSAITAAVLTVLTLLFLTGLFALLPEPALAAIVIAAVVELIDIPALRVLYRMRARYLSGPAARADFTAAVAAMLGVLVFDTLPGLFIGIGISVLLLLYRASRPHIAVLGEAQPGLWVDRERHADAAVTPGVAVVRVESGLFFANADHVRDALAALATDGTHAVVLDARSVPTIDVTAARMLIELTTTLRAQGVTLAIARDIGQVRDLLRLTDESAATVFPTVDEAVLSLTKEP
ncbi:high affinity sulfate transporter 1 [Actinomycetospora succinea]|uniref:High affinity sulfate transporter 1 n=1 Tax=Actinomycetospora succinea TaxID=663603 RepID=A0A4R6USP1_9PSEU|nr:SulP family inorganic anion transporter [Actinomycetospora succinea]TDQ46394.1 high affinity sulfate transporter 1 [Actinomycetospora succinea]